MLRVAAAVILLAHGVGHGLGLARIVVVSTSQPEWSHHAWQMASSALEPGVAHACCIVLWTLAMLAFLAVAASVVGWLPHAWFAWLGILAVVSSMAALLIFPTAVSPFQIGLALMLDLAVAVAILWNDWEPDDVPA